ncbi:hypothetical protein ACH4E8_07950 [Streptomyces sp. NPDC017979]|uniref:hypothetical protein n=1 Tax=Streptomyces sp. NPDC017979 TaxID=3365024 RepID=UPI0037923514
MNLASTAPLGPVAPGSPAGTDGNVGGLGRLLHGSGPWRNAAKTAGELRTRAASSHRALETGHQGVARGGAGLTSVPALQAVLTSWQERLASLRDECAYLDGALLKVAQDLPGVDGDVGASVRSSARTADGA